MSTALARDAFLPPPTPGMGRALTMALFAHALLVLALSLGVQWRQSAPEPVTFAAELWAQVPTEAAPPAPEPVPTPAPAPQPKPAPKPAPPPPAAEQPPKPADIVLEKKKALQEAKKKQELEQAKAKAAQEKDKAAKLKEEKQKEEKQKEDKQKAEKRLKEEKAAEAQRKKEAQQAAEEAKQSEQRRKEAKERALRLAGTAVGNGDDNSKGSAAQSAAPSASYGAKVIAEIKHNFTQLKEIAGNPTVEYDVYTDATGNVLSVKLRKKSGDPYWDDVAYNAIVKTAKLPRDENGRVPSPMTIVLNP